MHHVTVKFKAGDELGLPAAAAEYIQQGDGSVQLRSLRDGLLQILAEL